MNTVRFYNIVSGAWFHMDDCTPEAVQRMLADLGADWQSETIYN